MLKPTILKYFPYVTIGVLILILALVLHDLDYTKNTVKDLQAKITWNETGTPQTKIVNKGGDTVTQTPVIQSATDQQIKALSDQIFQMSKKDEDRTKKIEQLTLLIQSFHADSLLVSYVDTISKTDTGMIAKNQVILPPRHFKDSNSNYSVDGTVLLNGVMINKINIPDSLGLRVIVQRPKGIFNRVFKPSQELIQAVHSNKLVVTNDLKTTIVKPKPSVWQRWLGPVVGIALGLFLGHNL